MSRKAALFIAVAGLWFTGSRLASAQDGLQHLMGTVHGQSAQQLQIRTTEGNIVSVGLDVHTRYEWQGKAARPGDLKPGARVVVEAEDVGGRLLARLVRIGVTAPSTDHTTHQPPATSTPAPENGARPEAHAGHEPAPPQAEPGHGEHQPTAPGPGAQADQAHGGHSMAAAPARRDERALYQSDMTVMAGMTPRDPMAGMSMPQWQFMATGIARLQYNHQGGPSGHDALESVNWSMVMVQRDVGQGRLTLMMMNSLEPATLQEGGSPHLFQTGETFEGRPIVDRQHPHDLFMNLSATLRAPLSSSSAIWFQVAPVGEPALGPVAFMHRASPGENPSAPLGHHWQDSSHITRNVITAGGGWNWLTLETSGFHGQEPDEERWNIDGGRLDSAAGRAKITLARGWSGQVSHGYLHEPETLEEGDTHRTTASLHYGAAGDRPWAGTLAWGRNNEEHGISDSFLTEYAHQLTVSDQVYGRLEWVEKDADLLETKDIAEEEMGEGSERKIAEIGALTLGYFRSFGHFDFLRGLATGIGGDLTLYRVPSSLESVYGDSPISFHGFLRWRWGMPHGGHEQS